MSRRTGTIALISVSALAGGVAMFAPTGAGAVAVQTTAACTQVTTPTGGVVLQCPVITGGTVEAYRVRNDRDFAYPVGELPRCYKNPAACGPQAIGGRGSVTDRDLHIGGGPVAKGWYPQGQRSKKSTRRSKEKQADPYKECQALKARGQRGDESFPASLVKEIIGLEWRLSELRKELKSAIPSVPTLGGSTQKAMAALEDRVGEMRGLLLEWSEKHCEGVLYGF